MAKNILQMLLFIFFSMIAVVIMISPAVLFNGPTAREVRNIFAEQEIAPQRLFIASWRNIKSLYVDPSMNNQDWNKWKYKYLKHIKTHRDVVLAVNSMLASLDDPYSEFYDKKKFKMQQQYIKDNQDYKKINPKIPLPAIVRLNTIAGIVESAEVIQDSPFYSEPKKGDKIISINNINMYGLEMNSAAKLISGKSPLSKVEVLRNGKIKNLSIARGCMFINKIDHYILDNDIVHISVFSLIGQNAPMEFKKIFQKYKNTAKGYIIDLRGDVGGLFLNAVYIADEIMQNGEIITIQYRNGDKITMNATSSPDDMTTKPVVILIDGRTASSSEILAGALRSNNKAILVGEPTYGKNVIQQIIPMPNNTCINLTTARYKFNSNYKINGILMPDYYVKLAGKDFLNRDDKQLRKACSIIKNSIKR